MTIEFLLAVVVIFFCIVLISMAFDIKVLKAKVKSLEEKLK